MPAFLSDALERARCLRCCELRSTSHLQTRYWKAFGLSRFLDVGRKSVECIGYRVLSGEFRQGIGRKDHSDDSAALVLDGEFYAFGDFSRYRHSCPLLEQAVKPDCADGVSP